LEIRAKLEEDARKGNIHVQNRPKETEKKQPGQAQSIQKGNVEQNERSKRKENRVCFGRRRATKKNVGDGMANCPNPTQQNQVTTRG